MKNLINKLKNKWDAAALIAIYLILGGTFISALVIINSKREQAELYCSNHHAIMITDKSGTYICIKEKSVVKW